MKPPSDNSFDTDQEIKSLKKIPLRKEFVKKYDNIEAAFKKTADEQGIKDYDKNIAAKLIKDKKRFALDRKAGKKKEVQPLEKDGVVVGLVNKNKLWQTKRS